MNDGMRIHVARGGQMSGPYALEDVRRYLLSGEIQPHDWAWYPGVKHWVRISEVPGLESVVPPVIPAPEPIPVLPPEPAYHHVSALKFIIFSALSFGIYDVFWFYRNWRFIKMRDGSNIMPFWRAIFSPIWCYSLTRDIARTAGISGISTAVAVAIVYLPSRLFGNFPIPGGRSASVHSSLCFTRCI
jgi:hypothetical protein